jgi:hypothetical protein
MKVLFSLLTLISLTVQGQPKKTIEISASLNSIDRLPHLADFKFYDSRLLGSGAYTNKGISLGLAGKYFLRENSAVCVEIMYTNRHMNEHQTISENTTLQVNERTIRQTIITVIPGVQWSMPLKKLFFLGGFKFPVSFCGEISNDLNTFTDRPSTFEKTSTTHEMTIPGGTIIGVKPYIGLNYYFHRKIAIGLNFGTTYQYSTMGGTITEHIVTTGTSEENSFRQYYDSIKSFEFSQLQTAINFTWRIK